MIKVYGIKNCDTVKKTLAWLITHQVQFEFIDFKLTPPDVNLLNNWSVQYGCLNMLNKKGTTWRKLSATQLTRIVDEKSAIELIIDNPSVVKRPVITVNDKIKMVGFDANHLLQIVS
ncbi:MAG: Spx/MgsR family RNA polymerase-binding regulatory protein [Cyclobacteriaceae bacterium]|jgi:arsenate reductase|nr:Spx/MgsR family RNA polymerase-binding regulatory protein [Cyclobacteriaceae bacterium]